MSFFNSFASLCTLTILISVTAFKSIIQHRQLHCHEQHPQQLIDVASRKQTTGPLRGLLSDDILNTIHTSSHHINSFLLSFERDRAVVEPYEKQPLPLWVPAVTAVMLLAFLIVPKIVRQRMIEGNTRRPKL